MPKDFLKKRIRKFGEGFKKKNRYENMSKDFAKNYFLTISVISCLRFSASLASPDKSIYGYLGQQTSRKQIFPTKR